MHAVLHLNWGIGVGRAPAGAGTGWPRVSDRVCATGGLIMPGGFA